MNESLLETLKALSDASRLRIVGLLAARPMAVDELSKALRLSPGTVAHHLKRLRDAGLVESRARHPYMEYSLRVERLNQIGRQVDEISKRDRGAEPDFVTPNGTTLSADDAKVLRAFFDEGRLSSIPVQEKKRLPVLRYLTTMVFTEPRAYPEKEVNQRLALFHQDVASLRRYLIDHGFVSRERGMYTVRPHEEWPT